MSNLTVKNMLANGPIDYETAWQMQRELVVARRRGEIGDTLILLEHPHTFTIGRGGSRANLLADDEMLARIGATVVETDRGGDITYHGPGQLVAYPLIDLRQRNNDVHRYLRDLEQVVIEVLAEYDIVAGREPKYTGVWVDGGPGRVKIAAIGVKVSLGVTLHGLALNVNTDLDYFARIIPCGITDPDKGVTSLATLLEHNVPMPEVAAKLISHFQAIF